MSRRFDRRWDWEYPPYTYPPPGTSMEDAWQFHQMMEDTRKKWQEDQDKKSKDKKEDKKPESPILAKRFSILELSIWLTLGSVFLGPLMLMYIVKQMQALKLILQSTLQ